MGIVISLLVVVMCCLVIWRTSDAFETSSELIGENLRDGVRGATINAIGSSIPELFTTIFFLVVLKDSDSFSGGLGTTTGSAIFNGMIIPSLVILTVVGAGLVKYVPVSKKVLIRDGVALLLAELVLIFIIGDTTLSWHHGLILILVYVGYIIFMFRTMSAAPVVLDDKEGKQEHIIPISRLKALVTLDLQQLLYRNSPFTKRRAWIQLIIAMIIMGAACLMLVVACQWMGSERFKLPFIEKEFYGFNIPIIFVSVVIASAATSVPDTILSIRDARAGNYDDAVSNAIGSSIFDVCVALGLPLLVYTLVYGDITMDVTILEDSAELRILLFILTTLAVLIYLFGTSMGKVKAILLLSLYAIFMLYIVDQSMNWGFTNGIAQCLGDLNAIINR